MVGVFPKVGFGFPGHSLCLLSVFCSLWKYALGWVAGPPIGGVTVGRGLCYSEFRQGQISLTPNYSLSSRSAQMIKQ